MNFPTQTSLQFKHLTKIFSFFYKNTDFRVPGPTWQRHQIEKVVDQGENIITNHINILFEKKKETSFDLEEELIHISVDMLVEILQGQPSRAGWSLYRGCLATRHGHARGDRAVYWLAVIRHFLKGTIPCFQAFSFHRSGVARYDPVQSDNLLFLKE